LLKICRRNLDGSFATQETRKKVLFLAADQLEAMGFRNMLAKSLKQRHVKALVERWKEEGLSSGTLKNRMSVIRWWAEKINKPGVIAKDNDAYQIEKRQYVTNVDKARFLESDKLDKIDDAYTVMSLRLQAAFGLRREEAIKFKPHWADRGDSIELKSSWTKGGRARSIPISNDKQRALLDECKELVGKNALIPADKKYVEQLRVYEYQTAKVGLHKMHGLRHKYAQERYTELTGNKAPAVGGIRPKGQMEREKDKAARLVISRELGHEREEITAVYLGRL